MTGTDECYAIWLPPFVWDPEGIGHIHSGTICGREADVWDRYVGLRDQNGETIDPWYPRNGTRAQKVNYLRAEGARVIKVSVVFSNPPMTPALRRDIAREHRKWAARMAQWREERKDNNVPRGLRTPPTPGAS